MTYTISNIQASIFVLNAVSPNGNLDLASRLKASCSTFLDKDPMVLPTDNAPDDIPRIIAKSSDEAHEIVIYKKKIGYIWNTNASSESFKEKVNIFKSEHLPKLLNFVYEMAWPVNRIGFITQISKELEDISAPVFIKNNHISGQNSAKFEDPIELQIQYIKRELVETLETNILVAIGQKGSGINLSPNTLIANFDVNTAPHLMDDANFSREMVIRYANSAFDKLLSLPSSYVDFDE